VAVRRPGCERLIDRRLENHPGARAAKTVTAIPEKIAALIFPVLLWNRCSLTGQGATQGLR